MPSELILQFRITQAANDAARAVQNNDQAAYAKARQRYYHYDAELQKLEKERNMRAIEELEAEAVIYEQEPWLSYGTIARSGVPFEVLKARGWVDGVDRAGMHKPAKLALIPKAEPQGTEP